MGPLHSNTQRNRHVGTLIDLFTHTYTTDTRIKVS